jgi:hypothetical protein
MRAVAAAGLAGASVFLLQAPALAVDWEVTGDVAAQGYEIVSPWGDVVLGRRRLMSTLGLAAYNLQGDSLHPFGPSYSVQVRMRVDADFGLQDGETSYTATDRARFVPGLQVAPVDVMMGYVEGRNLLGGALDFRVGRQYQTNVLGWWSFDGGLVRVNTPFYFALESYGGFEQRGGLPLSTARYESQGVWRGAGDDALRQDAHLYPSFQFGAVAPAFGVALETSGLNWIKSRVDYRRVYNTGEAFTGQFAFPDSAGPGSGGYEKIDGLRVSSDRIGYSLSAFVEEVGALRGGFVYDLYFGNVTRAFVSADYFATRTTTVGLDAEYFLPSFDADSIFNWFTHNPSASAMARVASRPSRMFQFAAQAGAKLWLTEGDPASWAAAQCAAGGYATAEQVAQCLRFGVDSTNAFTDPNNGLYTFARSEENRESDISADLVANGNASYAWYSGKADVRAMVQTGFGDAATNRGRRVGGTISAQQALVPGLFWLGGRVSTYDWHDPLRPDRDATSFGYVIAPELQPIQFGKIRVEWEHEMNRLVGHRFRILGLLTMRIAP